MVRSLLDGALAPLRNVHKFDVALRLPLVLGLAHLVGHCRLPRREELAGLSRRGAGAYTALVSSMVLVFVACCAVGATAAALLTGRVAQAHTYTALPRYWSQVAGWLGRHDARGRALIVPASHGEQYLWGVPTDNPLQPLASSSWTERNGVPLVPTGGIRMLDAIGARLEAGTPSPGLASVLRTMGIDYLVVRNDLDPGDPDNVRPVLVQQALAGSPGIAPVADFGPIVTANESFGPVDQNLRRPVPALRVWRVGAPGQDTRTAAVPLAGVGVVAGGPESVLDLADAGQAPAASVLAGAAGSLDAGTTLLTDGLRRREVNVGTVTGNRSATVTTAGPTQADRPLLDYRMYGGRDDATARLRGARSVTASSSAADPTAAPFADPSRQPYAAVDGDRATYWQPSPAANPAGQWIQLTLPAARSLDRVTVTTAAGSPALVVAVRTDTGTVSSAIPAAGTRQIALPSGRTSTVRVTITRVLGGVDTLGHVGIAEVAMPGVHVTRTIVVPRAHEHRVDTMVFAAAPGDRSGCVVFGGRPICAVGLYRQGEDDAALDRTVTLPGSADYAVQAQVAPRPGPVLDALLAAAGRSAIRATASSVAVTDPRAGPSAAVDGSQSTGWVASADDPNPTLTLSWHGRRTVSSLRLLLGPLLAATAPTDISVASAEGIRTARVSLTGEARFAPLVTDRIVIGLQASSGLRVSVGPQPGQTQRLGLGVSDVTVPGVEATSGAVQDARPVQLACGTLPAVVDGNDRVELQATTTVGDMRSGAPIAAQPCAASPLHLTAGTQRLVARSTPAWRVDDLVLRSTSAPPPDDSRVATRVTHWGPTYRSVHVASRSQPALLTVTENANPGWHATLGGRALHPVTVAGFLQGYLVPAGAAATVHLEYTPDHTYRAALLVGGATALLLLALVVTGRRRRVAGAVADVRPARASGWGPAAAGLVALTVAGGAAGAVVTVAAAAVVLVARRLTVRRGLPLDTAAAALAGLTYAVVGVALAAGPWGSTDYLADRDWMQLLCLSAVAWTATAGLGARRSDGRDAAAASPAVPPAGTPPPTPRSSRPS